MSYNTKNYFAHGGEELVIGGKLTILAGATVDGLTAENASITPMANLAESEATTVATLKSDFNALLQALKTAGLMADDDD